MNNCILIAAAQRSGSTYLASILAHYFNCKIVFPSDASKGGEHELSEYQLYTLSNRDYVANLHLRCSLAAVRRIETYNLHLIITIRNIFDTIISIKDHIRRVRQDVPSFGSPLIMSYVPRQLADDDDDRLEAYILDFVLPWYFSFYSSWINYSSSLPVIRYEELVTDPRIVLCKVLSRLGLEVDLGRIDSALRMAEASDTNKNIGVCGRGTQLESKYMNRIKRLADYFPNVDFSVFWER